MKNNIKTIKVGAGKPYDVLIGKDLLNSCGKLIKEVVKPCKVAIITDDKVDKLYSNTVISSLQSEGFTVCKFVFKKGEKSKNIKTYGKILNFLAENKLTRSDLIVALGGGVVGDMAGFSASSYLRGVKYVQIPTTLLAQIDSSVGGKTAIDLTVGKNLVGAFYQPSLVVCDINTLNSLDKEIFIDGMGEEIKYALLDKNIYELLDNDELDLVKLVALSVDYKRKIVEEDEFEKGNRKLLNLGHTIAHGIEKLSKYKISHGKAVSMGIKIIVENSFKHGYITNEEKDKILKLIIDKIGELNIPYSIKDILTCAENDKKRSGDKITLVMVKGIGNCVLEEINLLDIWGYIS